MSQHCRANPCCGDRPCSGIPLPQDASGLTSHNVSHKISTTAAPSVGGTEGELKDDQLKTTVEICRSAAEDMINANIQWRLDPRYILRLCDAVSSSPTPASDIAALREKGRLIKSLEWKGPTQKALVAEPFPGFKYTILDDERGVDWSVSDDKAGWTPVENIKARLLVRQTLNHASKISFLRRKKMLTERQIYAEAGRIIQIAMGKEKIGRGRGRRSVVNWKADEDPLAYWCGVEAIVNLVERSALSQQEESRG